MCTVIPDLPATIKKNSHVDLCGFFIILEKQRRMGVCVPFQSFWWEFDVKLTMTCTFTIVSENVTWDMKKCSAMTRNLIIFGYLCDKKTQDMSKMATKCRKFSPLTALVWDLQGFKMIEGLFACEMYTSCLWKWRS